MSSFNTSSSLPILFCKRYLRLTILALVSTIFAYILLRIFPSQTVQLGNTLQNGWLIDQYNGSSYSFFGSFWEATYNTYRFGELIYIRPLWTMRIELFGSFFIYLVYRLIKVEYRVHFFSICVLLLLFVPGRWGYLITFPAGAIIFELWKKQYDFAGSIGKYAAIFFFSGLFLGSNPTQDYGGLIFNRLRLIIDFQGLMSSYTVIYSAGAILILLGLISSTKIQGFFHIKLLRYFGRISFALYLFHAPVLLLITTRWFTSLDFGIFEEPLRFFLYLLLIVLQQFPDAIETTQ